MSSSIHHHNPPNPASRDTRPAGGRRPDSIQRVGLLSLLLIVLTVGVAVYGIHEAVHDAPSSRQLVAWAAMATLLFTTIVLLLLGRHIVQRAVLNIRQRLEELSSDQRAHPSEAGRSEAELIDQVLLDLDSTMSRLRARIDRLQSREEEIDQIKNDFVRAVSHELRTPLSSIKAYTEMLLDGEAHDASARRNFCQVIASEADRLQRLINSFLDLARFESEGQEVQRSRVQLNEVVREVLQVIQPHADRRNLNIEPDLHQDPPAVLADRDMLHLAVMNVVENAVKYTSKGGHVRVRTSLDDHSGHLTLTVEDDGIGIPSPNLAHVFDRFYRTPDGATMAPGSGLGLSLVKRIVETAHHGRITISSEPGAGTTVSIRLPLIPANTTDESTGAGHEATFAQSRSIKEITHEQQNHTGCR